MERGGQYESVIERVSEAYVHGRLQMQGRLDVAANVGETVDEGEDVLRAPARAE